MKHSNPVLQSLLDSLASAPLPGIDLSLERISHVLAALGSPQAHLPPVIHIAGTNGKGSLSAYLTAIFQAAGYRVHRFTSPYLVRINEEIVLANEEISDARLIDVLSRVKAKTMEHPVTYFEAVTAAAFIAFSETPADVVILETGLGGRLDATNTISKPAVTAITPISLDHTEFLGDTIEKIAFEKAGIIKAGMPCVVGPQVEEAMRVLASRNDGAPLYRFNQEWKIKIEENGFHYSSATRQAFFPKPNLIGEHQIANAATAIAVIDCFLSTIVVAQSKEEMALPLNGKKNNLTKGDLLEYFAIERLQLNQKMIDTTLQEIKRSLPLWETLIAHSFLSEALQKKYRDLLHSRCEQLGLLP